MMIGLFFFSNSSSACFGSSYANLLEFLLTGLGVLLQFFGKVNSLSNDKSNRSTGDGRELGSAGTQNSMSNRQTSELGTFLYQFELLLSLPRSAQGKGRKQFVFKFKNDSIFFRHTLTFAYKCMG